MKELINGFYATRIYLPLSSFSRWWKRARRKNDKFLQDTKLPETSWKNCTPHRAVKIWEPKKSNGNIRISELAIINAIAKSCENGSNIFEIGTFDGRTSLNISFSVPAECNVFTLDLQPNEAPLFSLAPGERHMVEKQQSGARLEKYTNSHPYILEKIHQLYGDSATFDFSPFYNSCSLVFVDGSHAYDYLIKDSATAKKLVKSGGAIIWHDYGIWEGVTRGLEELEQKERMGLKNISGTSLVYWRRP